ncbi:hypothetical protein Bca4012_048430 [Brassica carinata]
MSSASSSSTPTDRVAKQRGIPTRCNCGEAVSRFTSNIVKNPGRLFHRCPMGSEKVSIMIMELCLCFNLTVYWMLMMKDKSHLFKWTDKSVVEEIEDIQDLFDVLLVDNIEFQKSVRVGEAMMKGHESRTEEMEDAIAHCEEKITKCIRELRIIKALFVCCLAMVFMYLAYA